jgi:hypothetical protein
MVTKLESLGTVRGTKEGRKREIIERNLEARMWEEGLLQQREGLMALNIPLGHKALALRTEGGTFRHL